VDSWCRALLSGFRGLGSRASGPAGGFSGPRSVRNAKIRYPQYGPIVNIELRYAKTLTYATCVYSAFKGRFSLQIREDILSQLCSHGSRPWIRDFVGTTSVIRNIYCGSWKEERLEIDYLAASEPVTR
jgi:hypothetical protein